MNDLGNKLTQAGLIAVVGAVIGVGQLLASKEFLTWRITVGRALSTGGLAIGAWASLAWSPSLPLEAVVGVAAILASLGTSALERMFQRFLGKGETP